MKSLLSVFIKQIAFLLQYIIYEITYYLLGGQAIIHDIIYKSNNKTVAVNRSGFVAVVTGGARGIGASLVKKLLQCDMTVIICCRNPEAADNLIKKVRENGLTKGNTFIYKLDLLSLNSVRSCAKEIHRDFSSLNILVNNAGIMFPPYTETEDGFESQWGVNYLGPFLFTHLLLPLLEKAPGPMSRRIINVSSCAHIAAKPIEFDNINMKKQFISSKAYAQSKLAQILFTIHLEKHLREKKLNVHVFAVHPGVVDTDIFNGTPLKLLLPWVLKHMCKSVDDGSTTLLHAAISPDLETKGGFYLSNCTVITPSKLAQDAILQSNLFNYSMKVLNIQEFGRDL